MIISGIFWMREGIRGKAVAMRNGCRRLAAAMLAALALASGTLTLHAGKRGALPETEVRRLAERVGAEYNICPELLQAVAWRESRYDPMAANGRCTGLMQVDSRWHRDRMERLGVSSLHDPEGNMRVAADYLAELFSEYEEAAVVLMFYSGDSRAREYSQGTGEMSDYVWEVLEESMALEREHGK